MTRTQQQGLHDKRFGYGTPKMIFSSLARHFCRDTPYCYRVNAIVLGMGADKIGSSAPVFRGAVPKSSLLAKNCESEIIIFNDASCSFLTVVRANQLVPRCIVTCRIFS